VTYTFIKGALQHGLFGLLSIILKWGIMSGIISVVLVFTSFLVTVTPEQSVSLGTLASMDPTATLSSLPQFRYLNYVEVLWAGLFIPILIGGGIFTVVISQGRGDERIVDFYSQVATRTVIVLGIVIVIWILGGTAYMLIYQSKMFESIPTWNEIMTVGRQGLVSLGMSVGEQLAHTVMKWIWPYLPIPAMIAGYIHIFGTTYAGWMGNRWIGG